MTVIFQVGKKIRAENKDTDPEKDGVNRAEKRFHILRRIGQPSGPWGLVRKALR